jgi:hypothetical protein
MSEVLACRPKQIAGEFVRGFEGMTDRPVSLDELLSVRTALVNEVVANMPEPHRKFLIFFECGQPDWKLLNIPNAEELPAVQWRRRNLAKLSASARDKFVKDLDAIWPANH